MRKLTDRHIRGFKKEQEVKPILEGFFAVPLTSTDRYHKFDFINISKKILIELKSRTCTHSRYRETLMNMCKIPYANSKIKEGYDIYFVFAFTDGIYYQKYTKDNRYKADDRYLYIPVTDLLELSG
jgi:hypothetical protein